MDRRLFEAARTGKLSDLHELLRENPLILHTIELASAENPLHVASLAGHLDFVKEIIRLKPDFAKEVNQDGSSPMHMASASGHLAIVKELLLKVDRKLCRLQGRERKTPLHSAAIKGRVDVVREMLSACSVCIEDVTVQMETALHLAVKNNQFEVVRVLLEWVREMKKEDTLNMKDEQGNTVLHLATWRKQRQVIEVLFGDGTISAGMMEVNAINKSGLTALDVLSIFPSEAGNREIEEILRGRGAMRARDIILSPTPTFVTHNQTIVNSPTTSETRRLQPNKLVEYFKFHEGRDSPSEVRSALLVIAVLVATATYQVGVNPPGGVWQDNSGANQNNKEHFAGESILGSLNTVAFSLFVLFNSIGFSVSLYMINILTSKFPLQLELQICMIAMFFTYNTAVTTIAPNNVRTFLIVITSILPSMVPLVAKWVRKYMKRLIELVTDIIFRLI